MALDKLTSDMITAGAVNAAAIADGTVVAAEIADDAVTTAKIADANITTALVADDAITNAKMADDAIGVAQLSASGTASSSTFLRGDNAWAAAGGGKVLAFHHHPTTNFGTTTISTSNNTWTDTAVTNSFTPTTTASKFLVYYGFGTSTQDSGTDGGFSCRVKKVQDSTTTYPAFLGDYASGNLHSSYYANSQNDTPARWNIYYNFQGVDADSHSTNSLAYTVQVGQYNISTLNVGNYYSAKSQITVLEVSTA